MHDIESLYEIFRQFPNITIDSRCCPPESLFFALKGKNNDGNRFAEKALQNGAEYAVIDDPDVAAGDRYIVVPDVLTAMQQLAAYHRRQMKARIIAVTGTNGKTTTKELIATVLATLLRLTEEDQFGVIEMGANHKGEIASLCDIAQPDFGIITNFGRAHLEGFGSFEGVIEAKTELFDYLREHKGRVFINIGNSNIVEKAKGIGNISYGINNDKADVSGYITGQNPCISVSWASQRFFVVAQSVKTHLVGGYNLENLLAAVVVGLFFEVEPNDINEALCGYIPENHRSQYMKTDRNDLIIDAYNANPSSMAAALRNFNSLPYPHKMVILGDMLEMGDTAVEDHEEIVNIIRNQLSIDEVLLVGEIFAGIDSGYKTFVTVDDLSAYLEANPPKDTAVLLKGSNGIGLERIIAYLK